jgi:hypothetical protein
VDSIFSTAHSPTNVARISSRVTRRGPPQLGSRRLKQVEHRPRSGDLGEAARVALPLAVREDVEDAAVDERVEATGEAPELEHVLHLEVDPLIPGPGLGAGERDGAHGEVDPRHLGPVRREEERVLAAAAADVEHPADDGAPRGEELDEGLGTPDLPGRGPLVHLVEWIHAFDDRLAHVAAPEADAAEPRGWPGASARSA